VRVKICGVTRAEDAREAGDRGAWAVGLILSGRGPRALDRERAARVRRAIPPGVLAVGVFVDQDPDEVGATVHDLGLDLVQLHGEEPPAVMAALPVPAIKAFPVDAVSGKAPGAASVSRYSGAFGALFDTKVAKVTGGTGKTFDWSLLDDPALRAALPSGRLVLAGGLSPANVADAVRRVKPFAVDVSSGVEASPGAKDPSKLAAFFFALRSVA
jgi:phosphoribosylanthranilate isomerase